MGAFFIFCVNAVVVQGWSQQSGTSRATEISEEEILRRAEKIARYLQRAKEQLGKNNLDRARSYTEKALEVDENSRRAQAMLEEIDKAEKAEQEELDRLKRKEEELKRQEEEAKEREKAEAEAQRNAKKIAEYLDSARKQLDRNNFDRARSYTEKALEVDENSRRAQAMLEEIDKAEKAEQEELDRLKRKEEELKRQEEEAKEREKAEAETQRNAEKIAGYLDNVRKQLDRNNFERARSYVEKALAVDENSRRAQAMLEEVDKAEQAYQEEQDRLKSEEAEKKKQEEEARQREKAEAEAQRSAKKIAGYLDNAKKQLDRNNFDRARSYAEKALGVEQDNREAQELLGQIDEAEKEYKEGRFQRRDKEEKSLMYYVTGMFAKKSEEEPDEYEEKAEEVVEEEVGEKLEEKEPGEYEQEIVGEEIEEEVKEEKPGEYQEEIVEEEVVEEVEEEEPGEYEKEIEKKPEVTVTEKERDKHERERRKKTKEAAKEQAKREAKREKTEEKVGKYISKSREYLSQGDYSSARRYAYMAREEAPESSEVADLIADIDKQEMFGIRKEEGTEKETEVTKALKEAEEEGDVFHKYDEGKDWLDQVTGIFKKKTYELGDIQEERIYTIDECVQLALHRSQRMVMSGKQVKLAEMRVWETRRALFPEITGKIERSVGKLRVRHYHGEKYQMEVKHTVFDGLGSWFEVRQAQTNLEIVKLEGEKIKNEVIAETKTAYYSLDKAIKGLGIQHKLKAMANNLYDIMEKAYQQEVVPRVEYLKVKGQNAQADFQYISAEEDISLAEMMLFHTMNMEPDQRIKIKPVDPPGKPLSVGLVNCYRLALANRPDFKIKEKTIEYYELDRKIMKAKGWPKITFHGSFGQSFETFQPTQADNEQRSLSPEWFAGVKGSIPVWGNTFEYNYVREIWAPVVSAFQGTESATSYYTVGFLDDLAYFTNLQEARVGFESAKYEYLKERNALLLEVKEKYFQYRKALLLMDVAKAKVEHQQMYVDVLDERMRYGEMEASKVLEEAEKLAVEEYALVSGDTSYFISLTDLNKAIGIPDYFKPEYEDREYEEWEKEIAERKTIEEQAEEAEIGAREKMKREDELRKRAEKIAAYLVQAQVFLSENNLSRARKAVEKALQVDPENEKAKRLLTDIEKAETE